MILGTAKCPKKIASKGGLKIIAAAESGGMKLHFQCMDWDHTLQPGTILDCARLAKTDPILSTATSKEQHLELGLRYNLLYFI